MQRSVTLCSGGASAADTVSSAARFAGLDRLRGLAVLLMVLDHVLAATGELTPLRYTLTRISLPLFMAVSGSLLANRRGPSARRWVELAAAASAASALVAVLPWMQPVDVLVSYFVALLAWPWAGRVPLVSAAACVVALATVPRVWSGYHPAELLALMCIGAKAGAPSLESLGARLPTLLELVGRRPLVWYIGHLAVMAIAAEILV